MHKIAFKNQDTLLLEHHISTDIAPAKTWIHKNEDMRQIINIAHNGEVLFVDTLTNDNTRTILAKQNGKVIKTTIDENGTTETKEEAAKNIELFSRFLQEDRQKVATPTPLTPSAREGEKVSARSQEIAKILKEEYPNYSQERIENVSGYIATRFPNHDSNTAIDAWELSRDILRLSLGHEKEAKRHELERILKIEPVKEFGTNYAEHYHSGIKAIQKVMSEQQGQVAGAFYRKELGDITIAWGEVTDAEKHKGYGLAHILDKHPDMNVDIIAEIVDKGKLNIQNDVRARLEYGDYVIGLSREFKGEKVNFIITAFEKKNGDLSSLSPKPKIADESDNVSPNSNPDSTPPPINNSLKNSEPVANVAKGSNAAQSDKDTLRSKYATLDDVHEWEKSETQRQQQIAEEYQKRYHPQRPHTSWEGAKFIATRYPTLDAKTALDAHEIVSEIIGFTRHVNEKQLTSRIIAKRHELERILKIEPVKEFGTNYAEHYHSGIKAIQKVMSEQQGQVAGAFYRKELGDITIAWGEVTDAEKHKGYGLAHILDKRKAEFMNEGMNKERAEAKTIEFINKISEFVEKGKLTKDNQGRMRIEADDFYIIGIKDNWKGEKTNHWVVTAYQKREEGESLYTSSPNHTAETLAATSRKDSTPPPIKDNLENGDVAASSQHGNSSATEVAPPKNHADSAQTTKQTAAQTTKAVALPDYAVDMERATELAARDKRQRLSDNLLALRTLAQLENGAPLSKEAQEALGRYSGFGGTDYEKAHNELRQILQSFPNSGDEPFAELLFNQIITTTKNAYYTPHEVISAIYAQLGFVRGRVLEPSLGIGNFFAAMPESLRNKTQRVGVELDSVSAKIAQYLHPNARIENGSFEEFGDSLGFDLIIGNPPYEGKMNGMPIAAAFLQKSLALAKDNGIIVQVVSNAFLDNTASRAARANIAKDAEFLGAVRLPSDTFSGTNVATDIVVLQKRKGGGDSTFVGAAQHSDGTQSLLLNDYYHAHPEHILGTLRAIDTNYNGKRWSVESDGSIARLPDVLEAIFRNRLGASDAIVDNAEQQDMRRYTGNARNGSLVAVGENVYVINVGDRFSRNLEEVDWIERINKSSRGKSFDALSEAGKNKRLSDSKKAQEMAKDYIALRDNLERLRKAEMENDVDMEDYRAQLKECYDYFKTKHCNGGKIAENRIFNAAFVDEPSYWLVRDLDLQGEHKILRQRVGIPIEIPNRAENLKDAIAISKTYAGKIDTEFVQTLLDDKAKVRQAFDEGWHVSIADSLRSRCSLALVARRCDFSRTSILCYCKPAKQATVLAYLTRSVATLALLARNDENGRF